VNKFIASITDQERQEITKRWLAVTVHEAKDYTLIFQIAIVLFILILASLYWNAKLSREIKERKKIEEELKKAKEDAESASRSKSEFLANMSHEIRTPMNAIIGFTELLEEQVKEPHLRSYVKTIKSAGNTLLMLINDILDLSKVEAGKMQLQKVPTNLYELFHEIGAIFSVTMKKKGLQLEIDIDETMPKHLLLDATRIRQIIFNLIGNAVKFTEKGSIKLSLKTVSIDDYNAKIDIIISVKDSGVGIPNDQLQKIFEAFEQKDGQDNKKYGGTGLGLAISKRLTEMMGGDISVVSQEGVGSEFIIKLYRIDIVSPQKSTAQEKIATLHSKTADGTDDFQDIDATIESEYERYDLQKIVDHEKLGEALSKELGPIVQKAIKSHNMQNVTNVHTALVAIAKSYNDKDLDLYTKKLKEALDTFDIMTIEQLLADFQSLLQKI
jgi:signal transduction histidine kinase